MAGGRFGATVVIDRPIEEVFAFLADGENDAKFSKRVLEIRQTTEGPPGVGTVYASTVKDGGVKFKRQFELTEVEPSTRIRWREVSTGPVVTPEGGYDLASAGEGKTQLSFYNVIVPHTFVGKLVVGPALRSARKGADDFAQSIKRAVEAS
ncbi:MAG TPA: SRPBCC family protein [Solirubrobacteraceae bacterium]